MRGAVGAVNSTRGWAVDSREIEQSTLHDGGWLTRKRGSDQLYEKVGC